MKMEMEIQMQMEIVYYLLFIIYYLLFDKSIFSYVKISPIRS